MPKRNRRERALASESLDALYESSSIDREIERAKKEAYDSITSGSRSMSRRLSRLMNEPDMPSEVRQEVEEFKDSMNDLVKDMQHSIMGQRL